MCIPQGGKTCKALSALSGIHLSSPRNGSAKGSGCPTEARTRGSCSAICDAEQLPHEGGSEGVYVLDAQQTLGVLGIDAAELGEHGHDLQEQEPADQPEEKLEVQPPLFPSPNPGTALKLHRFGGINFRTS